MRPPRTPVRPSTQQAPPTAPAQATPFGTEFQAAFLRVLLADHSFAALLVPHVKPHFFQNDVMAWAWGSCLNYHETYKHLPSWAYLFDCARKLEGPLQTLYITVLNQVCSTPITDEVYLRDTAIEYVRRSLFRQAFQDSRDLFAANKFDEAYDLMQSRLDQMKTASAVPVDRGWLAEEFSTRVAERSRQPLLNLISTGIPQLDKVLEGGAYPGFLGTWVAYPKRGKTTMLVNLGIVAMRAHFSRVLHIVLEGSRSMVEARYDAAISHDLYANVKRGDMDAKAYEAAVREMSWLAKKCVIRGFTENWETNILHIDAELKDLKTQYGWEPELIIVDYADLMRARTAQQNETGHQSQAYKDLKALANRGYRVWTASQAQRPKNEDWDHNSEHVLSSRDIADAYAKVRVCDFIGTLNSSAEQRDQNIMKIFPEMFRDGPGGAPFEVAFDFARMTYLGAVQKQPPASVSNLGALQGQKAFSGKVSGKPPPYPKGFVQTPNGV